MRVGIVCPYSLTLPGGVQGQVLGLARSLRAMGHEARVLAPCDGPPPELFVTPLGNSLPTAANGSVAPLAPDPAASLRTIRALRDEEFDVLHLHEPIAPGPTNTAAIVHPAPIVGTFHAAGDSAGYRMLQPFVRWMAGHLELRCAVSPDAAALAKRYMGGTYEVLFNGIELDRYRGGEPTKTVEPDHLLLWSPRAPQGPGGAPRGAAAAPGRRPACGSRATGPTRRGCRPPTPAIRRVEWLGRITEAEKAARLQGASVFCAPALGGESFGVVLLEAMAAGTAVVASDIPGYRNVAAPGRDAVMVPPGRPVGPGRRAEEDPDRRRPGHLRPHGRHRPGRVVLDGPPGGALPRAVRADPDRGRHHAGVPSRGPAGP